MMVDLHIVLTESLLIGDCLRIDRSKGDVQDKLNQHLKSRKSESRKNQLEGPTQSGVDQDIEDIYRARVSSRMMCTQVRDENVETMEEHLSRDLLRNVKAPNLPWSLWLLPLTFENKG